MRWVVSMLSGRQGLDQICELHHMHSVLEHLEHMERSPA